MDKQQLLEKTVETLRPLETQNLMDTIRNLTIKQIFSNWIFLLVIVLLLFLAVYKKSKVVILTLFFLVALVLIFKFTMPAAGEELNLKSIFPFAGSALALGGVLVYFIFIKE